MEPLADGCGLLAQRGGQGGEQLQLGRGEDVAQPQPGRRPRRCPRGEQKAIWRILGSPGVLLADAVPAGIWRPETTARRLDVTVESFVPLDPATRKGVEREAARLAAVRGPELGRLTIR